jgi:phosphohistidine phosphatase
LGAYLTAHTIVPDAVLCSSAARTRETLECLGVTIPTILSERLYLASAADMLIQLQQTDDAVQHIMIIGHNPGMHELVVRLMDDGKDEKDIKRLALKFPTCACARLSLPLAAWKDLEWNRALLETFLIGKELPEIKHVKQV